MKIGIIGGGASGLLAAINAKNENNEVIIFERNNECAKKILVTGNGRCNYWNDDQDIRHYESSNSELIEQIINEDNDKLVLDFFNKLGLISKIKNGYYYPFSNQAITMKNILLQECYRKNINIKNNFLVNAIEHQNNSFNIKSENEIINVDKLIIATGSFASPKTGSDGMGYKFLKEFGHTIINPLPALVQLESEGKYLKLWDGIRSEVKVSLYINNIKAKEEEGEIQLTNYGVSGICIFNLSNLASKALSENKKVSVKINFLPFVINEIEWLKELTDKTNKNIFDLLTSILNNKLAEIIILKSNIDSNKNFNELSDSEKNNLINNCFRFNVDILRTKDFTHAQVCSGGVKLTEINLKTMESKIIKDLYITGELLDLTGECGGYNLGIAFRSGLLAGLSAGDNND